MEVSHWVCGSKTTKNHLQGMIAIIIIMKILEMILITITIMVVVIISVILAVIVVIRIVVMVIIRACYLCSKLAPGQHLEVH